MNAAVERLEAKRKRALLARLGQVEPMKPGWFYLGLLSAPLAGKFLACILVSHLERMVG